MWAIEREGCVAIGGIGAADFAISRPHRERQATSVPKEGSGMIEIEIDATFRASPPTPARQASHLRLVNQTIPKSRCMLTPWEASRADRSKLLEPIPAPGICESQSLRFRSMAISRPAD